MLQTFIGNQIEKTGWFICGPKSARATSKALEGVALPRMTTRGTPGADLLISHGGMIRHSYPAGKPNAEAKWLKNLTVVGSSRPGSALNNTILSSQLLLELFEGKLSITWSSVALQASIFLPP